MTPERWQRVKELFQAALEQDHGARADFLSHAAPDDPALAEEVLGLLASEEQAGTFLSAPASAAEALPGGRHVGPYRILGEMGHGGMGAVYRAIRDDDQYQKQVAIKLVRGGTGPDFILERFKAERQILAGLEHPNIARLLDGGTTGEGWPWFAMEFVEGEPIDAWCASRKADTAGRLELFRTVCSAVQYAHQRLVIHRDLKPANILVTAEGVPKLLDFGIAKLLRPDQAPGTVTTMPLMTPEYASPEQVKGEPVSTASDVYSLGVQLYELLARRRPYEIKTRSPEEIARVVCQVEPKRPSAVAPPEVARQLAGDLDAIAMQALRKEPQRRYASVQELSEDLGRHLGGLPVRARGDRLTYLAGKFARRHKAAAAAAALVALTLVGGIVATARQARIAERNRAPSIAVLPFVDLSANKDHGYFSDGIAEEILNALAQVEGLHVAGRTSSFSFKGKSEDLRGIGQKLNVAHVLEGSVRKEGNRVRVTAQLVGAADGYHLWSKTFDREMTGVFVVQDEISRAVVEALKVRLIPGHKPRQRTASSEGYTEYLLGRQFFHRSSLDNYRRAAAAYERALATDPGFAPAWAGLAMATFWIADVAETSGNISQGYQRAMAMAEKAVVLDPELADGYAVRGALRSRVKWDWEDARADSERALALNAGDSANHESYAVAVLLPLGRLSEAIGEAQKATDLDPLSADAWSSLGLLYWMNGQLGPAQAALERSLRILPEQGPAAFFLAVTLLLQKRPSEALAAAEQSTYEQFRMLAKPLALNDLGRTEEAHRLVEQMIARHAHDAAYQIAESYAWFGERDRAFGWLERAYVQHDSGLAIFLKADPLLRGLRGDPRFAALLKKMNLPAD
jgi:TolB-like protein/Tfp pilus assembly protein PilF